MGNCSPYPDPNSASPGALKFPPSMKPRDELQAAGSHGTDFCAVGSFQGKDQSLSKVRRWLVSDRLTFVSGKLGPSRLFAKGRREVPTAQGQCRGYRLIYKRSCEPTHFLDHGPACLIRTNSHGGAHLRQPALG